MHLLSKDFGSLLVMRYEYRDMSIEIGLPVIFWDNGYLGFTKIYNNQL